MWVTSVHVMPNNEQRFKTLLVDLGYVQINIDEGWFKDRNANGTMVEDFDKFPSGMKALGQWVKNQTATKTGTHMRYGLYTSRGTCQCGTGTYKAVGSNGYEKQDVDWMVTYAGADYLKVDSCCGSQDHATAFSDYAKFRDALNATGVPVYLSLCGWKSWYAPPDPSIGYTGGASLGNSWRIAGDGSDWAHLTDCANTQASVASYAAPGGWNDPDLLIGPEVYVGGQTDEQARAQFTLWSIFPTNLLISQNVLNWSSYALETYSNTDLIAINQDKLGLSAKRIVGGDLTFPCSPGDSGAKTIVAVPCNVDDPAHAWIVHADSGKIESKKFPGMVLDDFHCSNDDGSPVMLYPDDHGAGTCAGKNQQWVVQTNGTITNSNNGKCLDVWDFTGPKVDVYACNGGSNQHFEQLSWGGLMTSDKLCLAVQEDQACTNVWGRAIDQDKRVLSFVNNGPDCVNVTCDNTCFEALNISKAVATLTVRDVWKHADIATIHAPFSFTAPVDANGFANAYVLSPVASKARRHSN
eukprot:INCI18401.3.p1 GENE.INCI18401.3~~INCI18401.3.p1  ORF type:complete len:524 (+),score=65.40 INCI18401.3:372-1943(+)